MKVENIPFTIHAGEVDTTDILKAILLGTKRLGHGVKCIDDNNLISLIKEKNILLEVCPTSNIQTNAFDLYKNHPIYKLYKEKVNISINTDIDLTKEYLNLMNTFNFSLKDLKEINRNSVNYTFLSSEDKVKLLDLLSE